ncbi:MAG TPA: GrpB family protein [Dermatophilaceae bacterium]|nr:GrpB family protein [Dermatophilaceae bacterium]
MTEEDRGIEFVRPRSPHNATIHLAEADQAWPQQFAQHAARISAVLGGHAAAVEHVGSTSVQGLAAKPIIDILLLVSDPSDEDAYVPQLEAAGYLLHGREPGWHQHRLLRGTEPPANVHVFAIGSSEVERMLLFRDRLRAHPDERELYERAKRELAARRWGYVQDYADAKSQVVEEIIARARVT